MPQGRMLLKRPAWAGVGTHTLVIYSHSAEVRDVSERVGRRRVATVEAFVRSNGRVRVEAFTLPREVTRFSLWFRNPLTGEESFYWRGEVVV